MSQPTYPTLEFGLPDEVISLQDWKLYEIGASTSEIHSMLIGRELFKETA